MTEQFQRSNEHFSRPDAFAGAFVLRRQESQMPKLKTKSGAKKRFKVTATGKVMAAKAAVEKAGQYAFRDRKRKKRTFRALWIQRLNAAVRPFGMTYSVFINGLSKSGITVDRKVLSDLAINEPAAFQAIAEKAKAALAA